MKSPVVLVGPEESLRRAAQVMQEHGIGAVVVEQSDQVVGILNRA
jgi:CBS domain-containing protein